MTDGGPAVGRVGVGVATVVAAREVPRPAGRHLQKLVVALADDEHRRSGGHDALHVVHHLGPQRSVLVADAAAVAVPRP